MDHPGRSGLRRPALLAAGGLAFCLLAALNSGGYRYGASDQAFYVPAVLLDLNPSLFPHDRPLLDSQSRLMVFDEALAGLVQVTGISLPPLAFAGYLAGLILFYAALVALGRALFQSWWTTATLVAAVTLRHRIAETGVNTLEGYLHPRMLAFAAGTWALVALLRGSTVAAVLLVAAAAAVHATTALWFGIWVTVAAGVSDAKARRPLLAGVALAAVAGGLLLAGPMRERLTIMDPQWMSAIAGKDYLFPHRWPPWAWLLNLALPVLCLVLYRARRAAGLARPGETGLIAGAFALTVVFLLSVPLTAARLALAVQLQVSRVFWMLDLLATAYVVWALVEAVPGRRAVRAARTSAAILAIIIAASAARGLYVTFGDRSARDDLVEIGLPASDWQAVMDWASTTPPDTHLLVDPGHAWRYGTSVRVAGGRDVFLEEVKDTAIAMYSRPMAIRVIERIGDLGDFQTLTHDHARALARKYDIDYLIAETAIDLPVVYRTARFRVYRLR